MKKNKLAKSLFALVAAFLMAAAPTAYAVTNDTSVVNSGDHVDVNANATQNSSVSVSNTNVADVSQQVNAMTNTGHNDVNGNIGGASLNTGSAGVNVLMETNANQNTTAIAGGAGQGSANMTDIVNTGNGLDANTSTTTNTTVGVSNTNVAEVSQSCGGGGLMESFLFLNPMGGCNANTGHNDMNDNIGGAGLTTGNAGIAVGMENNLNKNTTAIEAGAGSGVLNDTVITNTGDWADINAHATNNTTVGVSNTNTALIQQWLNAHANTGYNDANDNIGGAGMTTGGASIGMLLDTHANSNATGIGANLSPLLANLDDVVNTGNGLDSNTSVTSNSSTSLSSLNTHMGNQHVWEFSSSGFNDTNDNIGATLLGTHGAGVNVGMQSHVNGNVNVLGGMLGSLLSMLMM